jgi:hypothetical protein
VVPTISTSMRAAEISFLTPNPQAGARQRDSGQGRRGSAFLARLLAHLLPSSAGRPDRLWTAAIVYALQNTSRIAVAH